MYRDTGSIYRILADTMYGNIGIKCWDTGAIYKFTGSIYRDTMHRDTVYIGMLAELR